MISTAGKHSTKLSLMSNICTSHLTYTDHPLEALIGSSFAEVLARIEGSGWLIQAPFFRSLELSRSEDEALRESGGVKDWTRLTLVFFFSQNLEMKP